MKESKGENIYSSGQRTDIERTFKLSNHQTEHWIEGDNAFAFTCEVENDNVTVDWFHNDKLVVPSNKHLIRNVKKKHTLLITDFDPSDISDYTVVISDNSCSHKIQFDGEYISTMKHAHQVVCGKKLGYENAQKPSTTQEYTYPVSDADTFDNHKKKWVYMEQTTCGKVSLPMETLNNTVKGQAIQSSINHLNLKSNNNHDNLFTFNPSIPQSTNGYSHRLWYYQFSQFKGTPGFLTELLTHDLTVFRVRTFHTNYLSQTSAGIFDLASVSRACQIKNTLPIEEDRHCIHSIALPSGQKDTVKEFLFKWPAIVDLASATAERQIINPSPGKVIPANSMRPHSKIVQLGRSFTYFSRLLAFLPKGTKQAVCYGNDLVIISPECENITCTENGCVVICGHGKSISCYKNSLAICSVKCDNVLLENNEIQVSIDNSFDHQSFVNQNFGLLL
ncbi:Hypothetical predicted protein [Mytilus galloprovincialis]|uniref:Ig-like domain-containing protein n=1 Tax=Mytilus galloprovincialis TaxID=29158 RepID=A0A8B6H8L5_MYTGA|nr:Hypothetical predicted protein [Mytilus galloprovincialis]